MEKETNYETTLTWADLVGNPAPTDTLDWDDCYGRDGLDWRRADRDGWGTSLHWDGR